MRAHIVSQNNIHLEAVGTEMLTRLLGGQDQGRRKCVKRGSRVNVTATSRGAPTEYDAGGNEDGNKDGGGCTCTADVGDMKRRRVGTLSTY
jgi:hypothetical protein